MRLLYLYPEEWTGRRAREVHTLSTCAALAGAGIEVALVTAGGGHELLRQARDIAGEHVSGLELVSLSRSLGPVRSSAIFSLHFRHWLKSQRPFDRAMIIHLKAAAMVQREGLGYAWEAHEIFGETPQRAAGEAAARGHAGKKSARTRCTPPRDQRGAGGSAGKSLRRGRFFHRAERGRAPTR